MVIADSTGRSYGRPPGGSLVEGSRTRSRVSRSLSRASRRLSRGSRRLSRGSRRLSRVFEGRRKCQLHRGGCGLQDVRRGDELRGKGEGSKSVPRWLVRRRSLPPGYEGSLEVMTDLEGMGVWVRIHRSDGGCHHIECERGASFLVSSLS